MEISETYRLLFDENNVTLQFHEIREKKKKDGSIEKYEFQDNTYHNNVKTALKSFLNKEIKGSKDIVEMVGRIERVEELINQIHKTQTL